MEVVNLDHSVGSQSIAYTDNRRPSASAKENDFVEPIVKIVQGRVRYWVPDTCMAMARRMPQIEGGGMSDHCPFDTKLYNLSGAHPERTVGVEIAGYLREIVDTWRFSAINDKDSIPERSAREWAGVAVPRTYHRYLHKRKEPVSSPFVISAKPWVFTLLTVRPSSVSRHVSRPEECLFTRWSQGAL